MTTTLLVFARALSFGSGMILVGVMAFRWLVLRPAFAGEAEAWKQLGALHGQLHRLFAGSAIVLIFSGLLLFWTVAAGMSDSSLFEALNRETLATVLFQTQFGTVCLWRIAFAFVLAATLMTAHITQNQPSVMLSSSKDQFGSFELAQGIAAVFLMISMAWTGHAAASSSPFAMRISTDAIHLLATGIWPAGLLPFALFLKGVRGNSPPAQAAIRRFSTLSLFVVLALIVTGIINSFFLVGSFSALVTTNYGCLLCLKLALFLLIMGIAVWNRFRLLPLLARLPTERLTHQLKTFVLLEFALAVAIIIVVSFLGITPPPG